MQLLDQQLLRGSHMFHASSSVFHLITLLAVGLSALGSAPVARAAERRPNVLFIYTDDQSYRTLSCYQNEGAWPWVKTPHIDRLAAGGVRFTHAYGAAWCTPSRACVLTGLLPHGIQGLNITAVLQGSYDPKVCRFWPAELRKAGYHTAMIGKWHIGADAGHGRDWDHSVVWNQADIKGDWYNNQLLGALQRIRPAQRIRARRNAFGPSVRFCRLAFSRRELLI